jgi:hypothetical protein
MVNAVQFSEPHVQAPIHMVQKGKATSSKLLPFFLLHGNWSGEVPLYCFTLARLLGSAQPFYGLDTYKYNSPDTPVTLEEIAAAHTQSIRAMQPEGPYLLGGFCSGAYLAYEVAKQLEEQEQKVELLVLIAPSDITYYHKQIRQVISIMGLLFHTSQSKQLTLFLRMRHLLRAIYRKILSPNSPKIKDFPQLLTLDSRLDKPFPPVEALYKDFPGLFTWLAAELTPKYVPENVAFIWAAENLSYRSRWSLLEQGRNSPVLPGHYMTFLNENIHLFAEQLKIYIDKVQESYATHNTPSS